MASCAVICEIRQVQAQHAAAARLRFLAVKALHPRQSQQGARNRRDPWGQWQLYWQVAEALQAPVGSAAEAPFRSVGGGCGGGGCGVPVTSASVVLPLVAVAMSQVAEHQAWA